MRLSTSTNIMSGDWNHPHRIPFEESVAAARAAGYRYLDANLCGFCRKGFPAATLTENGWEEHVRAWRSLGDRIGVEFRQAHAYFSTEGPVEEGGVPGGDFGEEMIRRCVLAAEILGAEWMVIHPFNVLAEGQISAEASYRCNLAYFRRWHQFWHEHHVGMAIENMYHHAAHVNVWGDIGRLTALVDELNEPDIGVCLDTGHAWITGYDPAECVHRIGKRLKCTHIAENHGGPKDEHIAPFMGTIDWPALVRALRDTGYENDFSFEIQHLSDRFPKAVQPGLVRFSYELGSYMLSDQFLEDAERLRAE